MLKGLEGRIERLSTRTLVHNDQYRIEMFRPNGGPHRPVEHNVAAIIQLLGWSLKPE
ncbi:MAG TPA: hypothetical protein VFD48_15790 [Pyrinomonadaceae bacterium]|nr:hypothetical protein [Pyrinomonadaceae bacterium]